jgi:hypothetical protein
MRVWRQEKPDVAWKGEVWHLYGDFRIVPRMVQMPRGRHQVKHEKRWFIYDGKKLRALGEQNGFVRLKDAKAHANEVLDERNRAYNMRLVTARKGTA